MSDKKNSMALVPTTLGEARELSAVLAKSALLPADLRGKEADVFVTVMAGRELGLAPMAALRSIHVIKGKPVMSADGMVAVALASGLAEYFRCVESSDKVATYETRRKGTPEPQLLSFTIEEAKLAGLTSNDNWKRYTAAMLRARAKAALCRDVYPDALAGVYDEDEARSFADPEPRPASTFKAPAEPQVIDAEVVTESHTRDLLVWFANAKTVAELKELGAEAKGKSGDERAELLAAYKKRLAELTEEPTGFMEEESVA
jgi:hypothetical protein